VRVNTLLTSESTKKELVEGARPLGATDPQTAARAVREMFSTIAPRYDLLNHVLSCNVDRLWWNRTARTFAHILSRQNVQVLDLCCGTGDLTLALYEKSSETTGIVGADFAHPMLVRARAKTIATRLMWMEADALRLPVATAQFDLVTTAFGFRNLADYDAGLREIVRVLRPGGECGILDFGEPGGLLGKLYAIYFKHVLPTVGSLLSGIKGPYDYLPASVQKFPSPSEMLERMRRAGFSEVTRTPYTFGIANLFRARK
jgi:demethylmenaquinone methyltransferase/2-methoxy-6-polyprenyl-1,4-benzoquinol methylase